MNTVPLPASTGPITKLTGKSFRYFGYNIAETSGSAKATVQIWDGLESNLLATVALAAGDSKDFCIGDLSMRITFQNGIQVVVTGAIQGFLRYG